MAWGRAGPRLVTALALALVSFLSLHAVGQDRRIPAPAPSPVRRIALVIGNDAYRHVPALHNAGNDAAAMARELAGLGFEVLSFKDLDRLGMNRAITQFVGRVSEGAVAILFYAGHGVQIRGANYLIPVDLRAEDENTLVDDAIDLSRTLERTTDARAGFALAILDACRDNPFAGTGRGIGLGRGLAPPTATPVGFMVVYSAGANQRALDRLGQSDTNPNGLFVRELLPAMRTPGLTVQEVVIRARLSVIAKAKAVGQEQTPAVYDQSTGSFYFIPPAEGSQPELERPTTVPGSAGVNLGDLKAQAVWATYQSRMDEEFARVEAFEADPGADARMKQTAWERFRDAFAEDNPAGSEDDVMRRVASGRIARLREQAAAPLSPLPRSAAVAPASQPRPFSAGAWHWHGGFGGRCGGVLSVDAGTIRFAGETKGSHTFAWSCREVTRVTNHGRVAAKVWVGENDIAFEPTLGREPFFRALEEHCGLRRER